ncbi:hypothetical protein TBLA_0B01660 [Henningerozyma blattae CBS 6284]|uniref:3-oxo-5-alpha-steroid 4-dehydrogenase C-terminal domain-containing protein n=1 Tax=Henningerozyma blattae (strain ATCC 34711 / CBS 6284 / DSM 70876 / NBRC 10599 / NRRL Y-10934 / UCD 77-7) TaxID=1071380 RepID=I2GY07_HENB6|nr:hypothetical protein TBLA_0B01660 [Tetrapisispora blattae CBS 6284]CCH59009.1 hypothetical protein TBLA_0B01660 [Tetrapisispora blattae CBS 6284]
MPGETSLYIKARSKSLKNTEFGVTKKTTLDDVLNHISVVNKMINKNRLRLTYLKENKQVPITSGKFFEEELHKGVSELYVKDLGPQISWRLVFMIEYIGPIIIHAILYNLSRKASFRERFAKDSKIYSPTWNALIFILNAIHYTKRELESMFLHKFSQPTMPLFNVFKNSFHYWFLNGIIGLSYFGYGFILNDDLIFKWYAKFFVTDLSFLLTFFVLSELLNLLIHIKLRKWGDLQKSMGNSSKRVALNDGFFKIFVAPNYTFEVWSWIWFTLIAKLNIFAVLFLLVSATQMYLWAQKKNKKYGTKRAFLIPYIF